MTAPALPVVGERYKRHEFTRVTVRRVWLRELPTVDVSNARLFLGGQEVTLT